VVDGPDDAGGERGGGAAASAQHGDRHHPHVPRNARRALAVVSPRGDDAGHVRAVLRALVAGVGVSGGHVPARHHAVGEGLVRVDAAVEDGDDRVGAADREVPRAARADVGARLAGDAADELAGVLERVLLRVEGVVGRGRVRGDAADPDRLGTLDEPARRRDRRGGGACIRPVRDGEFRPAVESRGPRAREVARHHRQGRVHRAHARARERS
jgi:hypothetical protein